MTRKSDLRICVLGGTSRVWRAVAPFWTQETQHLMETIVWARRDAEGVDVVSGIDGIVDLMPQCFCVIAMWGVTSGPDAALQINVDLARQAQAIGRALGASMVIHMGTGAVYAPSEERLTETSFTEPRHAYGRAKLAAEQAVMGTEPKPVILRLGNVVGTDSLAAAVRRGATIDLDQFPDGSTPSRSWVAPDDLAKVLSHTIQRGCEEAVDVVNVSGASPLPMDALLRAAGIPFVLKPAPSGALPMQHLDTSRLQGLGIDIPNSSNPTHLATFLKTDGSS